MASETQIANMALALLGVEQLASLDDDTSQQALEARTFFEQVRDELQEEHPWNFNQFRSEELAAGDAPSFGSSSGGYDYAFALPNDPYCLRVLGTSQDENKEPWSVEGRFILLNVSSVYVHYLGRVSSTGLWTPRFVRAFVPRLAYYMAYPRTQSMSVTRDMNALYEQELKKARGIDGMEGSARVLRSASIIDVRRG